MITVFLQNVPKTNKRYLIAVKLGLNHTRAKGTNRSNSVRGTEALSPLFAAAGLAHILSTVESQCQLVYFVSEVSQLSLTKEKKPADICKNIADASTSVSICVYYSV